MTEIELEKIECILHNGQLLVPLDGKVKEFFDSDKIIFQAALIDGKIVLTSPRIKSMDKGPETIRADTVKETVPIVN